MFFEVERINKLVKELKKFRYSEAFECEYLNMKDGFYKTPEEAQLSKEPWTEFHKAERWGGVDRYAWFKVTYTVTEDMANAELMFRLNTGHEGQWDATNPQFLAFVNGELIQGLDVNHTEFLLTTGAEVGQKFVIEFQAYSGLIDHLSDCRGTIHKIHKSVESLYFDLWVPLEVCKLLPKSSMDRRDILKYLTEAVNMLDFRKVYNESFYKSVNDALTYLNTNFYNNDLGERVIARCVGHTHIDVAWKWDLEQTRKKVQRSFSTVLQLMKEYDDYIFMSSQPQLYKYLKEDRPDLYEEVKKRIEEGRWEAEGGMWVEADCNLSSGESLVRQILYGKKFFRDEFGIESKILWLPDVFGYSAALPQILKKFSMDYFMTTKISWNEYNKLPYDTFYWEGLDGSSVLSHFVTTADFDTLPERFFTTYNGDINANAVLGAWERYQQKDIHEEVLISYGYGDGGGGPTKQMIEVGKRFEKGIPGAPIVKQSTSLDYFQDLEKSVGNNPKCPRWVGELYFEYHRGTLTSMARNKRYNRKSEFAYEELEWLASMAQLVADYDYPREAIDYGWEIICLNQFHDIIPGSSIKKVYDDSKEQYEEILGKAAELKEEVMKVISSSIHVENDAVVVFNPLSFDRQELISFESDKKVQVYDGEEALITTYEDGKVTFYGHLPAKGYKSFTMKEEKVELNEPALTVTENHMENAYISLDFDAHGHITSFYDKVEKREVLKDKGNVFQAFEDKPHNWDAWDINIYYQEKMWIVEDDVQVSVVEATPLKGTLCVTKRFMDSTFKQFVTMYHHSSRVDFDTTIDWKETHVLLKVAFPVDIHATEATYDIQFGNIKRPTHWNTSWDVARFEVCGHKWADVSEDGFGVSLLNDCKYGYDIKDGVMRLTLLKSATHPNKEADKEIHHFTYSLYPHKGDFKNGETIKESYKLNVPVSALTLAPQEGELPEALSFIQLDQENVIAEVVKKSEDDQSYVIRVHEAHNRRCHVKGTLCKAIKAIVETDLEEKPMENSSVTVDGQSFEFTIKPFEIKTFSVQFM